MTEQSTIHIFLIDDDNDDRFLFKDALSKTGVPVAFQEAEDCLDALDKLEKMKSDVPYIIFIDLNMPDIDGFECIRLIKKRSNWAGIPLIVYSTSGSRAHIEEAGRLGATAYMKKPSDFWKLCEKIEKILAINLKAQDNYLGVIE